MKRYRVAAAAAVTVLLCSIILAGCGGDDAEQPVRSTGTVEGTVTAVGSGSPIEGAQVTVQEEASITTAQLQDATDSAGNYRIENVPSGIQVLACSAEGYFTGQKAVSIGPGIVNEINFELRPSP